MPNHEKTNWLLADDETLLAACDVHTHRASGPGGQRRNKVATAVRIVHRPTGITATGEDSRHQPENKTLALKRLRMNLACRHRQPVSVDPLIVPQWLVEHIAGKHLTVGRKNRHFWPAVAFVLDVLQACEGQLAPTAGHIGISTANCSELLTADKHALAAANSIRKVWRHGPLR